jgi:hypothetical protein
MTDNQDNKVDCLCQAPHQAFMEGKLKETYVLTDVEQELKEVVKDPNNYSYREELKSLYRKLAFATRPQKGPILEDIGSKFEKIIDGAKRGRSIANFPLEGTTSEMSTAPGVLVLTVKHLPREELTFFPEEVLKKLGDSVQIRYSYPVERFEYLVSYEGKELPMNKAFNLLQDDFEDFCMARASENYDIRLANKKERSKKYSGISVSGQ